MYLGSSNFSIVVAPVGNLFATLDIAKIATTVLFVASATNKSVTAELFKI